MIAGWGLPSELRREGDADRQTDRQIQPKG